MIDQTLALFLDAYRQLNSRKMFWVVLIFSALIVLVFAAVGIDESSLTLFGARLSIGLNTNFMSREVFYNGLFWVVGINIWLTWAATLLAIISTAGIFPDLMTAGTIDLYLARPVSRLRLLVTKYVTGLLFVSIQVAAFSLASFLVIGVRGGSWEPRLFLAIPIVVCFFSYLYCVSTLIGVLTRSTIAAIFITLLAWLLLFLLHGAEKGLLFYANESAIEAKASEKRVEILENQLANRLENPTTAPTYQSDLDSRRREIQAIREQTSVASSAVKWHNIAYAVMTVLPKTSETIELLEFYLLPDGNPFVRRNGPRGRNAPDPALIKQTEMEMRDRPLLWIIGTSLGFEVVVLGLAGWVFCRRDY